MNRIISLSRAFSAASRSSKSEGWNVWPHAEHSELAGSKPSQFLTNSRLFAIVIRRAEPNPKAI